MRYQKNITVKPLIYGILILSGCGQNAFQLIEPRDPAEQATIYLDKRDPTKAINLMLQSLGSSYKASYQNLKQEMSTIEINDEMTNAYNIAKAAGKKNLTKYVSILASAHAQKFGIDPLSLALAFADNKESESSSTTTESTGSSNTKAFSILYPVLPEANDYNIFGLNTATAILVSIDQALFTPSDYLKKSLFLVANATMLIKKIDKNGDGEITPDEVIDLSEDDAINFYSIIINAASSSAAGSDASSTDSNSTAKKIADIQTKIDSSEGETQSDKVKDYLSKKDTSSTPTTGTQ